MISEDTKLEEDNKHDEHAVAVILDSHTVGHLPHTIVFQQCKKRAYEMPLYLCGHMECLPCPPHSHIYVATRHVLETQCLLV